MSAPGWSAEARAACGALYREIFELPFVRGLADGTLPPDVFARYLAQDALYLAAYSCAMQTIADRLPAGPDRALFARFASDGVAAERAMQERWKTESGAPSAPAVPTAACRRSMDHVLRSSSEAPLPVALASVLPCFAVYAEVGEKLAAESAVLGAAHPYRQWIDEYAAPAFAADAQAAAAVCDAAVHRAPDLREAMSEAYRTGVVAERDFWTF